MQRIQRIGLVPVLVASGGACSVSVTLACHAQGDEQPLFSDNYPQLVWQGMPPALVFEEAFRGLDLDVDSCSQRAKVAWRVWREHDPDIRITGDTAETRAAIRARWPQVDLLAEIERVFEVAAADLTGSAHELAQQAWLGMHGLAQATILPTRKQFLDDVTVRAERYGLSRLLSVLRLSDVQMHAVKLSHDQFMEVHRLFLNQAYDVFDEERAALDDQLAQQPLFHRDADAPPLTERRDQLRLAAFERSHGPNSRISPTAYSDVLLQALMTALVDLEQASEQSRATAYAGFIQQLHGILTDDQLADLPEAENAYEVGRIIAVDGVHAASGVRFVSPRFDVRLLIDSEIEPVRTRRQGTLERERLIQSPAAGNA